MQQLMSKMLAQRLHKNLPMVETKPVVEAPTITEEIDVKTATLQASKMLTTKPGQSEVLKKPRQSWKPQFKLIHVGYPEVCDRRGARKRYQVELKYKDETGRKRKKTILFGNPKINEYVDNASQIERIHRCVQLKHTEDLFHPNHWRLHLLNSRRTLAQAFTTYIESINLK